MCAAQTLGFLRWLVLQAGDVELALHGKAKEFRAFGFAVRSHAVRLDVRAGRVENVHRLGLVPGAKCSATLIDLLERRADDSGGLGVAELRVALHDANDGNVLFAQLVHQVGGAVELALTHRTAPKELCDEGWLSGQCRLDYGVSSMLCTQRDRATYLVQYSQATEAKLGRPSVLTLILDDSRVGRRAVKLLACLLPCNWAAWLPVQVLAGVNETR